MRENKVMITGGSSFVGRHLTSTLSDNQYEITSVYHQHLPEPMSEVFPVCSDFSTPDLLLAPLRDIRTVFHLAWAYNLRGQIDKNTKGSQIMKPLNLTITENIVKAMESLGTKRIVFLSAIGASKNATHPFLREKYLAELCILNSKIPAKIIIRSAPICGGEGTSDRMTRAIERILRTPLFYPIPHSDKKLSPVHIDFLVEFLMKVESFKLSRQGVLIFELFGSRSFTVRELFENLAQKRGYKTKIPMGGVIGDSIAPLIDRQRKEEKELLRFRDYCDLANDYDQYIKEKNPASLLVPDKIAGFEKIIEV